MLLCIHTTQTEKTKNGQMKYCVEHKILVSHMHLITTQYTAKSGCQVHMPNKCLKKHK